MLLRDYRSSLTEDEHVDLGAVLLGLHHPLGREPLALDDDLTVPVVLDGVGR